MPSLPKQASTDNIPHEALRAASTVVRADLADSLSRAECARRVKTLCPKVSLVKCRAAVDRVVDVRYKRRGTKAGFGRQAYAVWQRESISTKSIQSRLESYRRHKLLATINAAGFRRAAQGSSVEVEFLPTAESSRSGIVSRVESGWIDYKSHGYRRGITGQEIQVRVPESWGIRVRLRDLAIVDGLLTLDAEPLDSSVEDIEVFAATWARQGKGLDITTERGCIARHVASGTTYHSTRTIRVRAENGRDTVEMPDVRAAIAGLKRKMTAQGIPADVRDERRRVAAVRRAEEQTRRINRLIERFRRFELDEVGHITVTRDHSLAAKNCKEGTDDFIERYLPGRSEATIAEIAAELRRHGISSFSDLNVKLARELAAACLHAIRADKSARRLLCA